MSFVRDACGLAGAGLVLFGVYQIYQPLTYVLGGVLVVGCVCVWSIKANKK